MYVIFLPPKLSAYTVLWVPGEREKQLGMDEKENLHLIFNIALSMCSPLYFS